jgi:hypothetical protein
MPLHLSRRSVVILSGVLIVIAASVSVAWFLRKPGCSVTSWLNPDVVCRVVDVRSDGAYLVEYFNADTNDLRLYIQTTGQNSEIQHPSGRVKRFSPTLSENKMTFNPSDQRSLLVNGEPFPITPK